ncbi:MAG: Uma2 family endonuclease [Bryobacterales bacterium]|nr:Uma2 family endonuclease [Bryobacterales bacterium]
MPVTASTSKELSAAASPAAEAVVPEPDTVEYPDRLWVAQSTWHGEAVGLATVALRQHFRDRADVLVAMELVVYYEQGNNRGWLRPDVQVVFGVKRDVPRSTFKVWEEGKAPDFVLEVASPSTAENDAQHKAREYLRIGVREYWRLDPEGSLMGVPLEGYRAQGRRYQRVESVAGPGRLEYLRSEVLGLELRTARLQQYGATVLVMRDPLTGEEFDDAVQEFDRQRRIAEDRASAAVDELTAARDALSAKDGELSATREELRSAEERARELEQQLRDATGQARPMERDSQG